MDPLQWMGAVRMSPNSFKKNLNNLEVIYMIPVHQLMHIGGKQIHQDMFYFKRVPL